jgi:NTP pyrophosphatase (non-canonical NTP hydrolase)
MDFNQYQELCKTTAIYPKIEKGDLPIYTILGLVGEASEIAQYIKKNIRDAKGLLIEEDLLYIKKELGDVLWYVAAMCTDLGLELNEVAQGNIDKLAKRKENNTLKGSGDNR